MTEIYFNRSDSKYHLTIGIIFNIWLAIIKVYMGTPLEITLNVLKVSYLGSQNTLSMQNYYSFEPAIL